jgi:hypothetical protein
MARSEFLPYQDADGDGLIDVCDDVMDVAEVEECPTCTPNPSAIVPNWRKLKIYEPFLNEKTCQYQITITTHHTTTGAPENANEEQSAAALKEIYDENVEKAIQVLLDVFDKDDSDASKEVVGATIEYTDYDLAPRPKSRLKLLYSVPYDIIDGLDEASGDEDDEEDDESTDVTVTYMAYEMVPKWLDARKGLSLYGRYLKIFRQLENSNILFLNDNSVFNLEDYGDYGFGESVLKDLLNQLDDFLRSKGYNIAGVGVFSFGGGNRSIKNIKVEKIFFRFSKEYELKKIKVYTADCPEDPISYISKLSSLKAKSAWKDPTAVAYWAHLDEIEVDLKATTPLPWLDFVKKYTYPEVYTMANAEYDPDAEGPLTCIGEALASEAKQIGSDVMDEVFGLADAIAYKFHENLCTDAAGQESILQKLGQRVDPKTGQSESVAAVAQAQAYEELEDSNPFLFYFCNELLKSVSGGTTGSATKSPGVKAWNSGFAELVGKLWVCGLLDLLASAIQCLFAGLSLEEALASMVENALKAMSIDNFGDLFIGLPPEKQAELSALVQKNLDEGNIFKEGSAADLASDDVTGNYIATEPWASESVIEEEKDNMTEGSYESMTRSEYEEYTTGSRRSLATTYDYATSAQEGTEELSNSILMEAYIKALIEVYSENLLDLVDELNKFPGAEIVSSVLATLVCPIPAMFNPSIMDFVKDLELPFCRNMNELALPRLEWPTNWLSYIKDLLGSLKDAAIWALNELLYRILIMLMVKICELIGDAICKALETAGDLAAALPDLLTGRDNLSNVIGESICGDDADDEKVNDTIAEMFQLLGNGGAAFSDQEQVIAFAGDLSSAVTKQELTNWILGDPSAALLEVVDNLIEFEYPDFRDSIRNEGDAASLGRNIGNLMPVDFRAGLKDLVDSLPKNQILPANPSLCASPEQIEQFCELRAELLSGRASPEQIAKMCEDTPSLGDLDDLGKVLQDGIPNYIKNNMPPLMSDPGCDNGLLPFEPETTIAAATVSLGNELEMLKVDFSTDMLGNGPGEKNWGIINMILSDTMGNPLTAHHRKAFSQKRYVDFNVEYDLKDLLADNATALADSGAAVLLAPVLAAISAMGSGPALTPRQRGAFPANVAEWLQEEMTNINVTYASNNDWKKDRIISKTLSDYTSIFRPAVNFLGLVDMGYNVETEPDYENDKLDFIVKGRKQTPDVTLQFRDNSRGAASRGLINFQEGFDLEFYLSDLEEHVAEFRGDTEGPRNLPSDNVRIKIVDVRDTSTDFSLLAPATLMPIPIPGAAATSLFKKETERISKDRRFEFIAIDDTLGNMELDEYPTFLSTFETKSSYTPQVVLLAEMLNNAGASIGNKEQIKNTYDSIMSNFLQTIFQSVASNEAAFNYGAEYDSLTSGDAMYVVPDNTTDVPSEYWGGAYEDAQITDSETEDLRPIENDDQILGVSYMQYSIESGTRDEENRVFFLDPTIFGGNYMNPAVYVKPLQNKGWLGFVDVMFPDLSPCKPQNTDLIDFGDIQDMIDEIYPSIPFDERLKSDPNCVVEVPYNRILDRTAVAGLQGLISAAIRVFVSVHFIKSLATFTKFSPQFPQNYSSLYASYIVEDMEAAFKDSQKAGWEFFNPFKDDEFWYAFLEQSVQMYGRRLDQGDIQTPPTAVLDALFRLNDLQEDYDYANTEDLKEAKDNDEVGRLKTLKNYRVDQNLEAVWETQEDAKLILKELVMEQVNFMTKKFMKNLKIVGMAPDVHDMGYYLLENFTQGSSLTINENVKAGGSIREQYINLPAVPIEEDVDMEFHNEGDEAYYTHGGEFIVKEDRDEEGWNVGQEYIGYYHVMIDSEADDIIYMVGEYHDEDPHDVLYPMVNKVEVAIGDVSEYGSTSSSTSTTQPFVVEKYVSINGTRVSPAAAKSTIASQDTTLLISDVYPGNLKIANDVNGYPVGLLGELGVRHGIVFYMTFGGTKYEIASAEVDALDLPMNKFTVAEANSKLLLCLINNLKEDDRFKLMSRYIFPLNKFTSLTAIYNNLGFLPSIGEITVDEGETFLKINPLMAADVSLGVGEGPLAMAAAAAAFDSAKKPGMHAEVETDDDGFVTSVSTEGVSGWASAEDREPGLLGGLFVREWDNWDQVLLRNSKSRIKKLFKNHYNSRDFDVDEIGGKESSPGQVVLNQLKDALKPRTGEKILPRFRRRRLISNPFNADGELCENKD